MGRQGGGETPGPAGAAGARVLAAEAVAAGFGYGGVLCWASACLVAAFRPHGLAAPYWPGGPGLRTDTTGAIAFLLSAVGLVASKYLRMRRVSDRWGVAASAMPRGRGQQALLAVTETLALLSAGMVVYLSVNAVTHPVTLTIQATHFLNWPTEGTLRVIALALCVAGSATARHLRATAAQAAFQGQSALQGADHGRGLGAPTEDLSAHETVHMHDA